MFESYIFPIRVCINYIYCWGDNEQLSSALILRMQCLDPALQPAINTMAETYGPGSRCVEVGFWVRTDGGTMTFSDPSPAGGCYQVRFLESSMHDVSKYLHILCSIHVPLILE